MWQLNHINGSMSSYWSCQSVCAIGLSVSVTKCLMFCFTHFLSVLSALPIALAFLCGTQLLVVVVVECLLVLFHVDHCKKDLLNVVSFSLSLSLSLSHTHTHTHTHIHMHSPSLSLSFSLSFFSPSLSLCLSLPLTIRLWIFQIVHEWHIFFVYYNGNWRSIGKELKGLFHSSVPQMNESHMCSMIVALLRHAACGLWIT